MSVPSSSPTVSGPFTSPIKSPPPSLQSSSGVTNNCSTVVQTKWGIFSIPPSFFFPSWLLSICGGRSLHHYWETSESWLHLFFYSRFPTRLCRDRSGAEKFQLIGLFVASGRFVRSLSKMCVNSLTCSRPSVEGVEGGVCFICLFMCVCVWSCSFSSACGPCTVLTDEVCGWITAAALTETKVKCTFNGAFLQPACGFSSCNSNSRDSSGSVAL